MSIYDNDTNYTRAQRDYDNQLPDDDCDYRDENYIESIVISERDHIGTFLQGYINYTYKELVSVFGKPNGLGDNYKISKQWILEDNNGNIITIYDWKSTRLYSIFCITPEEFLKNCTDTKYRWHVGGIKNLVEELKTYIDSKL